MRFSVALLAVAAVLTWRPAAAINKCTEPDGRVVFQDAPCAGKGERLDIRPGAGVAPRAQASSSPPAATESQRLEGIIAASQRSRRSRDLRERLLPEAEVARTSHREACETKQRDLAAQQYAYRQNLYGKTHAAQIASEMAATAALCDTKDRELKEAVDALTSECAALACRS